ncbi:cell surface protein [Brachyspira pilosicoli]|uniref:Cell surface protein n=1 Tax=Brachyspira pilosicoli TaxID=52584 RepID=A0A5C8F0M0_BRAPL|nr:cell surface protein [Brachyspira pilosicoli]TXJ43198.1 cell surface protein [Brachyspira pilosicoli]
MKKVLLTAMALLTIASTSVFGMYGKGNAWINFLTDGNQFRARMDQLGFVLGNGTIKGTFGFKADRGYLGAILDANNNGTTTTTDFKPTLSAGIGYTSDVIGVGVGYNFTYINENLQVHTPVLTLNALNNSIRFVAPIQVAVTDKLGGATGAKYTGVAFNDIQFRYYTGIDAFNAVRLFVYYRNNSKEYTATGIKEVSEAFGIQARFFFLNTQVGDVNINPYIRVEYHTALKGATRKQYTAEAEVLGIPDTLKQSDIYDVSPYEFSIRPVLSLAANSDYVSLYFEPSLGYTLAGSKTKVAANQEMSHALTWGAYAELYITPVKDLEWYFEMDVNGNVTGQTAAKANENLAPVYFETSTGITWYLPAL